MYKKTTPNAIVSKPNHKKAPFICVLSSVIGSPPGGDGGVGGLPGCDG